MLWGLNLLWIAEIDKNNENREATTLAEAARVSFQAAWFQLLMVLTAFEQKLPKLCLLPH